MEDGDSINNVQEANSNKHSERLKELKLEKFLTQRIFRRISENMHYEIFKYLNYKDLLQIRFSSLSGYQLTSNPLLRSRIKNYMKIIPDLSRSYSLEENKRKLGCMFEQTGNNKITLKGIKWKDLHFAQFTDLLQDFPNISHLNMGNYIYIY